MYIFFQSINETIYKSVEDGNMKTFKIFSTICIRDLMPMVFRFIRVNN